MNTASRPEPSASDRFFVGSPPAGRPSLRKSIVVRFGCYLTLLVSLAMAGMFSALLFADYSHQDAAVINQAGSLRMLTYRLALDPSPINRQALQATLAARLDNDEITRLLRRSDADAPIRQQHAQLRKELQNLDLSEAPALATLDTFVSHIDGFVGTLQSNAEYR